MRYLNISKDRYNIKEPIDIEELNNIVNDKEIKYIQVSDRISDSSWMNISEIILENRKDIEIRLIHFLSDECDLSILKYITNVEKFSIEHIRSVQNLDYIKYLSKLKSFSIGIFNLDSLDCLALLPSDIQQISISQTKLLSIDLSVLSRFTNLKKLFVENHNKNIEVISELNELTELILRSVKLKNLEFLSNLTNLKILDIKLGSIKDISALAKLTSLKYLELWQVRGIESLEFISTMIGLETIFLQSLNKVKAFPNFNKLRSLKRLYLENMNELIEFKSIDLIDMLEEFYLIDGKKQNPEDYFVLLEKNQLKNVQGFFGSKKKNEIFKEKIIYLGINSSFSPNKALWREMSSVV